MRKTPACPICSGSIKKNGRTTSGRQRWRCRTCNHSFTIGNPLPTIASHFRAFLAWITTSRTLDDHAAALGLSARTLQRHFQKLWLIPVPRPAANNTYDEQVFIDGTYLGDNLCLLIASTSDRVLAWHWCHTENTSSYLKLLDQINRPRLITCDGHRGALKAITMMWGTPDPTTGHTTRTQRCRIHIHRNIKAKITRRPNTAAGKALLQLSRNLLTITDTQEAAEWLVHLQQFHQVYHRWLDEKTYVKDVPRSAIPANKRKNKTFWYTHDRTRSAYYQLLRLHEQGHLFAFLDVSCELLDEQLGLTTTPDIITAACYRADTNVLEGGFNAPLKALLRAHRGLTPERQRTLCDWWLFAKTGCPTSPEQIARDTNFGQDQSSKAKVLAEAEQADNEEHGGPAEYDDGIDAGYSHSMGIRKGPMK
ncbi:transposase [Corynebacterium sp. 13CS0277]|uniref:IS1249 family transposase n=1 Tax=Corynebacterium sp. 13CS0277 TaxID=2071994 RepID=UPI000D036F00|nr:IS1249 family transposase [Corynebacterium sp. 13CS0277]PRQ10276.1 transposase [Corynebacterium sp. 13CS0277]